MLKSTSRALQQGIFHKPKAKHINIITALPPRLPTRTMASKTTSIKLSRALLPGTWDSHMHIVDPTRFPLSPKAAYTPQPHTLSDASTFYNAIGIQNLVLVQPSIYGTDNSCMLEALRALTPAHGRAIVELDPSTTQHSTMREWHDMGVRGVRVNLVSVGRDLSAAELKAELTRYADLIRPWGWVLQLYIPLALTEALETLAPELDVKLCIDHFGSPSLPKQFEPGAEIDPYEFPGFAPLVRLLQGGRTWVKLSAPYRLSRDPEGRYRDLESVGRELVRCAPTQVVYATDWPHTRFESVDSAVFVEMCYRWCGEGEEGDRARERLFKTNAEILWDVGGKGNEK